MKIIIEKEVLEGIVSEGMSTAFSFGKKTSKKDMESIIKRRLKKIEGKSTPYDEPKPIIHLVVPTNNPDK